jgi:hypothetical protein
MIKNEICPHCGGRFFTVIKIEGYHWDRKAWKWIKDKPIKKGGKQHGEKGN